MLFAGGAGVSARRELMNFCNVYTIIRLPTGIFYSQGAKTNVLFFTSGVREQGNTKEVAFSDMRITMASFALHSTFRTDACDASVMGSI